MEEDQAKKLEELLHSLPFVKQVKETSITDPYSLASEGSLSEDWMVKEEDKLQILYNK